jgi:hypothetical protein
LSTSLFGEVETKESEPEIIKAETDSIAYLIALEKFYILDKIKKDIGDYSGVELSRLVEFKLLNEDGTNIVNTITFKNKDSIENSIRDKIFSSSNILEKNEESNQGLVDSLNIKELLPFFTIKKDEFDPRDITYYKPKSSPKYVNRDGFYYYFQTQGGKPKNLIFSFQYYASDWLFFRKIQLSIDGKPFEYIPRNVETDSGDGRIWEWFNELVRIEDKELIESLYVANSVKIKIIGRQYSDVVILTKNQIQDIGRSIDLFIAMGGKLPFKIDSHILSKNILRKQEVYNKDDNNSSQNNGGLNTNKSNSYKPKPVKSNLTKQQKIKKLSKIFDSKYGSELAVEIATEIYSDKIDVDSITHFTLEKGWESGHISYKNINLYNSKNQILHKFKDVRIQGFIDYDRKNHMLSRRDSLEQIKKEKKKQIGIDYQSKSIKFKELIKSYYLTKEFETLILKYLDREKELLTVIEFDSISLSKTFSNFAVIKFYLNGKYNGSIELPYPIPSELSSKF